jgi:hypothetical protein
LRDLQEWGIRESIVGIICTYICIYILIRTLVRQSPEAINADVWRALFTAFQNMVLCYGLPSISEHDPPKNKVQMNLPVKKTPRKVSSKLIKVHSLSAIIIVDFVDI